MIGTLSERAIQDNSTLLAVVTMLAGSATRPRLAMRGTSMSPLLREPMVLELGVSGPDGRVGDILVFKRDSQLIAHRITSLRNGVIQTCGDARPWSPEYPDRDAIVGKIIAVFDSDQPDARRVDGWLFRTRGLLKAHLRPARALPFRLRVLVARLWGAIPWRRERAYVTLVSAMSAIVRRDHAAFKRSLSLIDPGVLAAVALRHRCSAMLVDAMRTRGCDVESSRLQRILQPNCRWIVSRSLAMKVQVAALAASFSRAQITFALLKGAARLHSNDADALLQPSSDIDILVPAACLEAAAGMLRAEGYQEHADPQIRENYRRSHHHAAPFYPSSPGRAVELHTSLAPPHRLSLRLNWEALVDHMIPRDGTAGRIWFLDDVGAAISLAVHSMGLKSLRDSVLLARVIARMNELELRELKYMLSLERTDPIRLEASLAIAADIAGIDWPRSKHARDYLAWCMQREDVPLYFSTRSQFVEIWYAGGQHFSGAKWYLLDPRAAPTNTSGNRAIAPHRLFGKALASACAYAYSLALRRPA